MRFAKVVSIVVSSFLIFTLLPLAGYSAETKIQELIVNTSFQDGIENWSEVNDGKISLTDDGNNDKKACKIQRSSPYSSMNQDVFDGISQKGMGKYKISIFAKIGKNSNVTTDNATFFLRYSDSEGNTKEIVCEGEINNTKYVQLTAEDNIKWRGDLLKAFVRIKTSNEDYPTELLVDDVSLTCLEVTYNPNGVSEEVPTIKDDGLITDKLFSSLYSDFDDNNIAGEMKVFDKLGIFEKSKTRLFSPDSKVSRTEFIVSAIKLFKIDVGNTIAQNNFNDFKPEEVGYNEVVFANNLGIISGYEDGTFRGNEPINNAQAIKIIVSLLGYHKKSDNISFPMGYLKIATDKKLLKNMAIDINSFVTKKDMAYLFSNTLNCDKVDIWGNSEGTVAQNHNICKKSGIVTRAGFSDLQKKLSKNDIKNDRIEIDGQNFNIPKQEFDLSELVGQNVSYYAKFTDNDIGDILCIFSNKKAIKHKLNSKDIINYDGKTLNYYDGDNQREFKITNTACVIYNYDYLGLIAQCDNRIFNIQDGYIILNDNDSDGTIDNIWIKEYTFDSIRNINKAQINCENSIIKVDFEDDEYSFLISKEGKEIKAENLLPNDIIAVAKNKRSDDFAIYEITVVTQNVANVRFTGLSDKKITINNTDFSKSPQLKIDENSISDVGKFYFHNSCVVAFVKDDKRSNLSYKVGYLVSVSYNNENSIDDTVGMRIVGLDGKIKKFKLDTVSISEDSTPNVRLNAKEIYNYFKDENSKNKTKMQLIKYRVAKNNIVEIITAKNCIGNEGKPEKDIFTLNYQGDVKYTGLDLSEIGDGYKITSNTQILMLPMNYLVPRLPNVQISEFVSEIDYDNIDNSNRYKVNPPLKNAAKYKVEGYNANDMYEIGVLIVKGISGFNVRGGNILLVDKISSAVNTENEPVLKVTGVSKQKEVNFCGLTENSFKVCTTQNNDTTTRNVESGDIICVDTDKNGAVIRTKLVTTTSSRLNDNDSMDSEWDTYFSLYTTINAKNKEFVQFSALRRWFDTSKTGIFYYSKSENKVKQLTIDELDVGDEVYVTCWGTIQNIIVTKEGE